MNKSCLSPAEAGLHWYWASAVREIRRRDNVTAESLTMMARMITDDTLTEGVTGGKGVVCLMWIELGSWVYWWPLQRSSPEWFLFPCPVTNWFGFSKVLFSYPSTTVQQPPRISKVYSYSWVMHAGFSEYSQNRSADITQFSVLDICKTVLFL